MTRVLPIDVPRETLDRLSVYADLVAKWNSTINLVAKNEDIWTRHIADSAQLYAMLPSANITLADFGSGGGFPGIVLAILGVKQVHLVESDQRKMTFLKEAARLTNIAPMFHVKRIEEATLPTCDVITARALASLTQLLAYAHPHMQDDTLCLFLKGRNYRIEVEEALRSWDFDIAVKPSVTADDAVILSLQNLAKRASHGKHQS